MNSILNFEKWGEFRVGTLFDIHPTKAYKLTNSTLMEADGVNPVVVNSRYNNGIGGFTNQEPTEEGNIITFSDTTSSDAIFYQDAPFVGYPHVQGMYPIGDYKNRWTKNSILFFLSVFKSRASDLGFDYVNKFTRDLAREIFIMLPIDKNKDPDWEYMEQYVSQKLSKLSVIVSNLNNAEYQKNIISTPKWKPFKIDDFFTIDAGSKLDKAKMDTTVEKINFVGRSSANNGITQKVNEIPNISPYKEGYLTLALGGEYLGSCFIQDEQFYTSQNVAVLIPKTDLSFEVKQFIATAIFKESQNNYQAFIKELNKHIKTDFRFKLPVDEFDEPDYAFMESYIQSINIQAQQVIDNLNFISRN